MPVGEAAEGLEEGLEVQPTSGRILIERVLKSYR